MSFTPIDISHRCQMNDDASALHGVLDRAPIGDVQLIVAWKATIHQGAESARKLAASARYESEGMVSHRKGGLDVSRGLRTGSEISHGTFSIGSFHAIPCSSPGSYSWVTQ